MLWPLQAEVLVKACDVPGVAPGVLQRLQGLVLLPAAGAFGQETVRDPIVVLDTIQVLQEPSGSVDPGGVPLDRFYPVLGLGA